MCGQTVNRKKEGCLRSEPEAVKKNLAGNQDVLETASGEKGNERAGKRKKNPAGVVQARKSNLVHYRELLSVSISGGENSTKEKGGAGEGRRESQCSGESRRAEGDWEGKAEEIVFRAHQGQGYRWERGTICRVTAIVSEALILA